jgi:hypothetical protein
MLQSSFNFMFMHCLCCFMFAVVARVRALDPHPPVFRRFADSLAPHQNLVRAETAAELAAEPAGIKVIHVYSIAL